MMCRRIEEVEAVMMWDICIIFNGEGGICGFGLLHMTFICYLGWKKE